MRLISKPKDAVVGVLTQISEAEMDELDAKWGKMLGQPIFYSVPPDYPKSRARIWPIPLSGLVVVNIDAET